jgi:hypothetical protein
METAVWSRAVALHVIELDFYNTRVCERSPRTCHKCYGGRLDMEIVELPVGVGGMMDNMLCPACLRATPAYTSCETGEIDEGIAA